ncbi:MAG: M48 family metalloprotease [Armatimonadota bacterium]
MARKSKVKRTKESRKQTGLKICDFQFPGEKSSYWAGAVGVTVLFILLALIVFSTLKGGEGPQKFYIPLYVLAWPVAAVLLCNWMAAKPRQEQLKKGGRQARVMSNNHSDLYQVLVKQANALGLKTPPDLYLVNDPEPILYSLPGARGIIIASTSLREALSPDEFEALLAHEITHNACKHVRMDLAQTFVRNSNPGLKILFFPILLMGLFSRAWCDLIEFTADRGALLITLKPSVVNSAIVKFAVARDPNAGISSTELQGYLDGSGDITTDAKQMERHFKVGQFMASQPGLRERIEQLTDFVNDDQGRAALAKMAELQGVDLTTIVMHKKSESDIEHVMEDVEDRSM